MKIATLLFCASLALVGCGADEPEGALDNVQENPQEHYNTATDPAGPRETTSPNETDSR